MYRQCWMSIWVQRLGDENDRGTMKHAEKDCPVPLVHLKSTWTGLDLNLGVRGEGLQLTALTMSQSVSIVDWCVDVHRMHSCSSHTCVINNIFVYCMLQVTALTCFIKNAVGINDNNNDSTLAREEFNIHANILSALNLLIMQVAIICNWLIKMFSYFVGIFIINLQKIGYYELSVPLYIAVKCHVKWIIPSAFLFNGLQRYCRRTTGTVSETLSNSIRVDPTSEVRASAALLLIVGNWISLQMVSAMT
jgi:hypothetical protein